MHALITGGTGFIGSRLAVRLMDQGHAVRLLSLIKTPAEAGNAAEITSRGAELIEASVSDRTKFDRALDGVDVVHHIAATMREADVPDRVFWDTNLAATQDLFRASRERGVRRFVYCSTMGVTGNVRGRTVDETVPHDPRDIYQRTKSAAERWVLEESQRSGFPATAVRPTDVYGPGDQRLLKLFQMIRGGKFMYLGSGRGRHHMVFIDDLLDGMLLAQERSEAVGQVFLLAGPSSVPLTELVATIAAQLEAPLPTRHVPYRPVWLLSWLIEAGCRPLGVQPPIYPRRVAFFAHDYDFDTRKARERLGWIPRIALEEGVRRTIAAYREKGLLA